MKKKIFGVILIFLSIPVIIYFFFPGILYNYSMASLRSKSGLTEKSIVVDNHTIKYLEGGAGEPVVMIHGFSANKDNWVSISKYVTGSYRVVAPDLPGFGESTKIISESYSIAKQVERINGFLTALNIKKAHFAGNSMGGTIIGKFTAAYPDKVLSLGFLAPGGVASAEKSEFVKMLEKGKNRLLVNNADDYTSMLQFVFVKTPPIPGTIKNYLAAEGVKNRGFNEKIFKDLREENYSLDSDASKIRAKTLILWGDKDRVLHVSGADILENRIKGSKKIIIEKCGHLPMIERPEETAGYYMEFLKNLK